MGWSDERYSNNWPSSRTSWRWMKRMIRWEIFKQLTKFTYFLKTDEEDEMGWSDERYSNIQTEDRWRGWDGMGWSDEKYSNNWPSSHTIWRQMKRLGCDDQTRDIQTIDQVHIHTGDRWRGWNRMIRWEIFKQSTKFTYFLRQTKRMGWGIVSHQVQILVVDVLSGQALWRYFGTPQYYCPQACVEPWRSHSWNGIVFHIADCNRPGSVKKKKHLATIILTSGATPHLPSHRAPFCNSAGMYFSAPELFPHLLPPSPRSYS